MKQVRKLTWKNLGKNIKIAESFPDKYKLFKNRRGKIELALINKYNKEISTCVIFDTWVKAKDFCQGEHVLNINESFNTIKKFMEE